MSVTAFFCFVRGFVINSIPAYDSSESDDDFDKAFQPLIIDSNMFLGDTW